MLLGVAYGQLVEPAYEVATTYVFGEFEDLDELTLDADESPGFIELSFDGYDLSIDLVRRPSHIPLGEKFCTAMLPAAVAEFVSTTMAMRGFDLNSIDRVAVYNIAEDPVVGCRCYARVMVNMGFAVINGKRTDPASVPEACERIAKASNGVEIWGTADWEKSVEKRLPPVHPVAVDILRTAEVFTRVRPVAMIR